MQLAREHRLTQQLALAPAPEARALGRNEGSLKDQGPEPMQPFLAFITLLLMALVTGVSFSHLLQRGPKADLPGPQSSRPVDHVARYGTFVRQLSSSSVCHQRRPNKLRRISPTMSRMTASSSTSPLTVCDSALSIA